MPKEVKQKEKEIKEELEKLGIRVQFSINNVESRTKAWEHTVGFHEVLPKDQSDKLWQTIRKHYDEWHRSVS